MSSVIERKSGYNNEAMLEYCHSLKGILESSKNVTKGTGKNLRTEVVKKYQKDEVTMSNIMKSIEYYSNKENKMENQIEFRDYQLEIISKGKDMLSKNKFLYLAMEVRTGKTLTSLGIADKDESIKHVLFITKKKAIGSIMKDYNLLNPSFSINVINYESLHTLGYDEAWDLIVCDEAHCMGAFPKPSGRAVAVKEIVNRCKCSVIFLSGTPTPESYSQMYHQVYMIKTNPFAGYKNFYRFCDDFVDVKEKRINGLFIKNYSDGKESILEKMKPYMISYTQKEAGFTSTIDEEILYVPMSTLIHDITKKLQRDLVVEGKEEVILADTSVKLMMKLHQLYSGTVKFESGNSKVLDLTKAEFIKEKFSGKKIGIFYKFTAELDALKQVFGDGITSDLEEFEDTDKSIALQIVSGREGISLRMADFLVYYNIDFSATSYWQSRDRMTTKDRMHNKVYWVFTKDGIEDKIYEAVSKKKDYTVSHFKKDLINL